MITVPEFLHSVTSGYWTVQVISLYANTLSDDIQYGQTEYASFALAKAAMYDPIELNPYK